nr:MAG TPA: hypothetical protein [Caudoviricetes sp.]
MKSVIGDKGVLNSLSKTKRCFTIHFLLAVNSIHICTILMSEQLKCMTSL